MSTVRTTLTATRTSLLASLLGLTTAACLTLAPASHAAYGDEFGITSFWAGTCDLPSLGTPPYGATNPLTVDAATARDARDCHEPGTSLQPQAEVPITQAGGHPDGSVTFELDPTGLNANGKLAADGDIKNVYTDTPPGVIGNPEAVAKCDQLTFVRGFCPVETQVGVINLGLGSTCGQPFDGQPTSNRQFSMPGSNPDGSGGDSKFFECRQPVWLIEPSYGDTAMLGFFFFSGIALPLYGTVRTDGDFGVRIHAPNVPTDFHLEHATVTVWGVPGDPSHDAFRFRQGGSGTTRLTPGQPWPVGVPIKPFLSAPTSCDGSQPRTTLYTDSWQNPGRKLPNVPSGYPDPSDPNWKVAHVDSPPVTGCNGLDFEPTLEARPTTDAADSPSGLDVALHIPQDTFEDPNGTVTAHLRDTSITFPEGLIVNPSGANGLDGCSSVEAGLLTPIDSTPIHFSADPTNCPDAAKIGTVQVDTPVLDHSVRGAIYVADPYDNPFASLLAVYITVNDPQTGIAATIAGEVTPDPDTGQLTTVVKDNPQLPLEDIRVNLFGGAGGSLRTPPTCGTYRTTSSLVPWSFPDSGAPADPFDTWAIQTGPSGSCVTDAASLPHAPTFDAGAVSPIAGAHTPFVVNLRRDDATQEFSAVTISPPPGLVAKLAGTTICSDADLAAAEAKSGREERSNPSCPITSQVGNVVAAAGAGPAPYYAPAKAYITGPYKGAPLSMAVITPATAGPFDLGTIVTRIALHVNSKTAEITAKADPIPHILQGIPLDVRSIHVALDKPNFSLNPTSCDPMAVNGLLTSTLGQTAPLNSRFQLGECGQLPFKPNMVLTLRGGTRRGKHPALTVNLMPRAGDANIASLSLAMPRSEFLENAHIRTICTRPDFAADRCPAGAIYGEASVTTPLLDYPLTGHVYLRSSDNLLPDVVPDLRGPSYQPIKLESAGRTDSIRGGIRNTLDFVPDAPFTQALIQLQGGNKGLLVNSRNICDRIYRATVKYTAHNGDTYVDHPKLRAQCGKKAKRGRRAKRAGHRR